MNRKGISTGMGAVAMAVAVALAGCSDGSGTTASTASGSRTVGMISGFGSVYVNGVEYESDGATIHVDGELGNDDYDLEVGMVVTVSGSVNADGVSGTATAISFSDELEGVVLENGVAADGTGTMNIMGQEVTVGLDTVFESDVAGISGVEAVAPGNIVEVSGYSSGQGEIFATRIEVKATDLASYGGEMELKGVVSGHDAGAMQFTIGTLIVDYADAIYVSSELGDGLYVEVKSDTAPLDNGDGSFTLAATKVEKEDDGVKGISGDDGDEIEIEGVITSLDGMPDVFQLNGQSIVLESETEFEDGLDAAALAVGERVEVEGYFNAAGQLVADSVEAEDDDNLQEFKDYVLSIDVAGNSLTLQGGEVITVTSSTIMLDSYMDDHYFDLGDLSEGDFVEVHAATDGSDALVATKLEREDPPAI
ncbi:MAG TPA: DUF5666 domain-containing protein [Gammaproteobacteria bacterium]